MRSRSTYIVIVHKSTLTSTQPAEVEYKVRIIAEADLAV
jgi:hypothetical protein